MSFLTIQEISHTYVSKDTATKAIENISMEIEEGEFVSFLGPSGCGKTTLLTILSGLLAPTAGKAAINGQPLSAEKAGSIGYMLQQDYLFPWKTIEENVLIGLQTLNKLTPEKREQTINMLKEMGLSNVEAKYPRELSGGMRQRAALVRTLATEPKILLLDEPFSALDYQTKLHLENLVHRTLKDYGKTAVLVTHDIGEAIAMSDRVFLFASKPGRLHKTFKVPDELRAMKPFDARQSAPFQALFQSIWKELEQLEK
ncbi:ABC transporter ATP-binding protein [Metabacillus sp. GX 13764]|uniref:ABC transporter ATP-binding protein n=1 Tax=Metabacillus kandeliae TaxID=2900151 RepID=UPI001E432395|nr:ABC transporter ATP-binding protein [Metabacillus kandeliae]MCD7032628.1 ABC transporter ATP-binding protein [Metabacillus kandeliae]